MPAWPPAGKRAGLSFTLTARNMPFLLKLASLISGWRALTAALALLCALAPARVLAQVFDSELQRFRLTIVTGGLEHPWGLAFLPDGRMLVSERPGRLRLIDAKGNLDPQAVKGLPPIAAIGQGGLLDVAVHPAFRQNGWIYLSYVAAGTGGYGTEVLRARLRNRALHDVQVVFRMRPKSATGYHFGSRLVFDREGYLYITLGDRGEQERAQRLDDHAGSVIRLHDDGRVPADNPFVRQAGALPEKFTLGNRNIQGAAVHPATGELWAHEHGPQGGDEINVIRAGVNYGWPVITYGRNYGSGTRIGEGSEKAGMAQPVLQWTPSIAPSGMAFYTGNRFPAWQGDLFVGALRDQMLLRIRLDGERVVRQEALLKSVIGRIRDVRNGPDGLLYLLTDSPSGVLARLQPVP
ncbi:PQQ-dependent sugar dehydrogenase [Accumulibacter sp.]|uniref:PQQ-dependent sugar dehydrogenase n=2 Tax=Accumulibacter sp. TaxID=2053492 RepID=UPI002C512873|nr:PQQ-dependent sugar dehydrogenase [Accumulibacter sp.]HNI51849.1 PQQ-dependent sugar dehydrogenase [Accumulibacter sp.]HNM64569.1 PQQ-dependent sugar dehydrogenase [Accumulibacter sp.]